MRVAPSSSLAHLVPPGQQLLPLLRLAGLPGAGLDEAVQHGAVEARLVAQLPDLPVGRGTAVVRMGRTRLRERVREWLELNDRAARCGVS